MRLKKNKILKHFEGMKDPRVVGRTLHAMRNIVFITIVGALCGLTGWEEIADFAEYHRKFFSRYLDLPNGLPSDDTLRRFFRDLKPGEFRKRFYAWAREAVGPVKGKTVSLDGKTVRGASAMNPNNPVHIVSVDSEVTDKKTGKTTRATRYYITSMKRSQAARCAECIRSHWGVESMHWSLDVTFGEDSATKRKDHSAENFNTIRKIALNVLKNDGVDYGTKRVSLKCRMLKAQHSEEYLKQLLNVM